jgi:hypothetical protein
LYGSPPGDRLALHRARANTAGLPGPRAPAAVGHGGRPEFDSSSIDRGLCSRGHRAPATTNNQRHTHRDTHHRCARMCKQSSLPPAFRPSPTQKQRQPAPLAEPPLRRPAYVFYGRPRLWVAACRGSGAPSPGRLCAEFIAHLHIAHTYSRYVQARLKQKKKSKCLCCSFLNK